MREEEKLARDVYRVLFSQWGNAIFANIAESEQTHTDTVALLIEKHGIEDLVTGDSTGVFVNPTLQALYDDLLLHGGESLVGALKAGAYIDETDMLDLQHAIDGTDNRDMDNVHENAARLPSSPARLCRRPRDAWVVYDAQVPSQDELDEIVDSPMERG